MKKFYDYIFSMQFAGVLLLAIAAAIGTATFIENDFGTIAAKVLVYNATWFELLLLVTTISLMGSVFKYKLYQRKKISVLFFHLGFVVIMAGAAITRFIGYEGSMSIREGEASNELVSDQTFVQIWINDDGDTTYYDRSYLFSSFKRNRFSKTIDFNGESASFSFREFIPNAGKVLVEDPEGIPYISFVTVGVGGSRQNSFIEKGGTWESDSLIFNFQSDEMKDGEVKLFHLPEGQFKFIAPFDVTLFSMMEGTKDTLALNELHIIEPMKLYNFKGKQIVFRTLYERAVEKLVPTPSDKKEMGLHAVLMEVEYNGETEEIATLGGKGILGEKTSTTINGVEFSLAYGSKIIELPFSLYLRDFQLERYPGSESPSSFASEVTVIDKRENLEMPYRIFMNNVLNHDGYRFFQSSYDTDEKGTILSVNHDMWGTIVTYFGYFVLTAGLLFNFFSKRSRFQTLARASTRLRETAKKTLTGVLITAFSIAGLSSFSQASDNAGFVTEYGIDKEHAGKFGELLVQDRDGRMKPINTLSSEILRKIHRKNTYRGLNSDQVLLGMTANPAMWQSQPIIKVSHKDLKSILGISGKYASFNDFINMNTGGYILSDYVNQAYNKKPVERNKFDDDIIKVDERVNILYMVFRGDFLTLFPKPDDANNKWYTAASAEKVFDSTDAGFVKNVLPVYLKEVSNAMISGNWTKANEYAGYIDTFQREYGSEVMPPVFKRNLEITYNKVNIFKRLFPFYGTLGFILLILLFITIFNSRINLRAPILIISWIIYLGFFVHTLGLAARWYIAGHAPWTNGYETMIFIAWGVVLSGIIFARKSRITLATTSILASLTLMVANLSWLDPEITSLVPVLKSYWLVIHVAVITSSYSFLGIGALLGFLNLILIILQNKKNHKKLGITIKELTNINEMNLIIGVFLITIGTFLGAVWANESWGRYWGWDPKETWALVTVLVYSFVAHMRLIPGLSGLFAFNFASLISFSSVLMTYFGVNYYLSGLHSYAGGDPVPIPTFVYYTIAIVAIISVSAYFNYKRNRKLMP